MESNSKYFLNSSLKICPHLNLMFLNECLAKYAYKNNNFCTDISIIKNQIKNYKKFGYMETKNLVEECLIKKAGVEWIILNNPQNLSFSSINKEGCIFTFNFDDEGKIMISTNHEHTIEMWDLYKKKFICGLKEHSEIVTGIEFFHNSSNKFLSCSLDKTIKLWKDYKCVHTFIEHSDWIRCINLNNDNSRLLSGCVSSVIKIWDLPMQKVLFNINNKNSDPNTLSTINSLNFMSTNPNIFITGIRSGEVKLFDIRISSFGNGNKRTLIPVQEFKAHIKKLNNVKLNRNDTYLLSSGRDSLLRLWDLRKLPSLSDNEYLTSEKKVHEYNKHKCFGYNLESNFWLNDKYILTGSEDNGFYIYETLNPKNYKKINTRQNCINLIKPVPRSYSLIFGDLEDISLFLWNANKTFIKEANRRYNEKYNEPSSDEEQEEENSKYEDTDKSQQIFTKMVEEIMNECGDLILKIFHSHGLTYSNGLNFSTLLEIIQSDKNEESAKILKTINEKFITKLNENLLQSQQSQTNQENKEKNKKNSDGKRSENIEKVIKCLKCYKINLETLSKKPEGKMIEKVLTFPNKYNFNKNKELHLVKEIFGKEDEKSEENCIKTVTKEDENNVKITFFKGIV